MPAMSLFYHAAAGAAKILAVSSSPVQIASGDLPLTAHVFVRLQAQGSNVYVTYDGTTPSSANGELLTAGVTGYFIRKDVLAMKFICPSGAATIFAQPCDYVDPGTAAGL